MAANVAFAGSSVRPAALVVMGVSGSGKSTIAALLANRLGWEYADGDWFHPPANIEKMRGGTPLTDADRLPWLQAIADWIDDARAASRPVVVACSALKRTYRDILVGPRRNVGLVYLEGDRELIARRLARRHEHFMPAALLDSQFAALEAPGPDEHPITVSVAGTPQEIVTAILGRLAGAAADSPAAAGTEAT
jgi:carbohydrate kinase (thermoresistant glucokinase family)